MLLSLSAKLLSVQARHRTAYQLLSSLLAGRTSLHNTAYSSVPFQSWCAHITGSAGGAAGAVRDGVCILEGHHTAVGGVARGAHPAQRLRWISHTQAVSGCLSPRLHQLLLCA